ncbi:MAG: hypothetical protein AAFQ09_04750 [Pseudomonadota bacterium]
MTAVVTHLELSHLRMPDIRSAPKRNRIGRKMFHDAVYDAGYDWSTLVYDCFYDPISDSIKLICPQILNFRELFLEADICIDGHKVEIASIDDIARCSVITLAPGHGNILTITHQLFGGTLVVGRSFVDEMADLNCVYTISRNNRLEWIIDWLRYSVEMHGLNAVVLSDNGSTDYGPKQLGEAIASVQGLKRAIIVHARFPFGPPAENRPSFRSLFLQTSLAELLRMRMFAKARAVLNTDIDELFYSNSRQSIFDATVASPEGYVRADAQWVYANDLSGDYPRHKDHAYVSASGEPKANRKWCIVPDGPLRGRQWMTHFIGSRKDPVDPDFRMWHFRQVSTNWKNTRNDDSIELERDDVLAEAMSRVYAT